MAQYDSARALALRLITKKGRSGVNLVKPGRGSVPVSSQPWKPTGGTAADQLQATVHAVFLSPVEARGEAGQFAFPVFQRGRADLEDSLLSEATHFVYIADLELEQLAPSVVLDEQCVGWFVESASKRYVVLRAQSLKPGDGRAVIHTLAVKG